MRPRAAAIHAAPGAQSYNAEHDEIVECETSRRLKLDPTQALNAFLANVERRAYRIAHIATGNPDDALDIIQDTMYKLVQRYSDRSSDEWPPLFYKILRSRINDYHRRRAVRSKVHAVFRRSKNDEQAPDPVESAPAALCYEPAIRVQNARALERLYTELGALPQRQQQAFLLRAWEGFDTAETAQAMGCSQGTVKTHYSRAIHTLRDKLGKDWQ